MVEPDTALIEPFATLVIKLGYTGSDFAGYAEQPGQRTVAGELRQALETVFRRPCELTCAGRTDAGVHAIAQYVSIPLTQEECGRSGHTLWASLVALTPDDISIRGVFKAPAGFSTRFDAQERSYRYRIRCGQVRPVLPAGHVWWLRSVASLDIDAMNTAASYLIGEHDFRSFCKAVSAQLIVNDNRSTSRYLSTVQVKRIVEADEDIVVVDVSGNAFLHNMVRIITGTLVEVGRGHRNPDWVAEALSARDRAAAGPTAPAEGLTLNSVRYPDNLLVPWE